MNVVNAAANTLTFIGADVVARRAEGGHRIEHAKWMLQGISRGYIQHEKAHRWLGYAQGLLVMMSVASLHDMKEANKHA